MRRSRVIDTQRSAECDHRQTISVSPIAGVSTILPPKSSSRSSPRSSKPAHATANEAQLPRRRHKRPPLSKHPKSVVSDATNSTYLSSDSEEDTVRSGELSNYSGSNHSNGSGIAARKTTTPNNNARRNKPRNDSMAPKHNKTTALSSTRLVVSTSGNQDSPEGSSSGSSSEVGLLQYSDNEDELYPPQLVSDDSEGLQLEEDDEFLQLINESSNRWRQSATATIQKTSTTATVSGNLMGGYPHAALESYPQKTHKIQEQQAEIEALRAQLAHQRISEAPVAHIEVTPHDHTHLEGDDLTLWSSADYNIQPNSLKRPDAASVVSKPPSPKSTTRAFAMQMKGESVSVVFTGNLTKDLDGDYAGVGIIRFANNAVYHGEMRHSVLHGKGSYTDANQNTWKGRFEHGRYVGP